MYPREQIPVSSLSCRAESRHADNKTAGRSARRMRPVRWARSSAFLSLLSVFVLACSSTIPSLGSPACGVQGQTKPSYVHARVASLHGGPPASSRATGKSVETEPGFADFDRRARAGAHLNVVFFGASLTWGANASDPQRTSYRANVARRFEEHYPDAHFRFFDAAIGGTGSQLAVFRLERDVLRHHPDLVFLDFTANDEITLADPETLSSYESLMRRIITQANAPVVQMIIPFEWNVRQGNLDAFKRRTAHLQLSRAYGTAVGDAVSLAIDRVRTGVMPIEKLWPIDGAHPGDAGYDLISDAAWKAYSDGVSRNLICHAPDKMIYADTYMTSLRSPLSALPSLPSGWSVGQPNRVSAYYDMLMSRWLDSEVVASYKGSNPQPLKLRFHGSMAMVFGEGTMQTGRYRVTVDGKAKDYDTGALARGARGNTHLVQLLASGLDPAAEHTLVIEPLLEDGQELRFESLCVAGGRPEVIQAP